jgi:ligand-binding SRPBCC domain-containing protein
MQPKNAEISIHRYGAVYQLRARTLIREDASVLWDFFSNPANLQKITPPAMNFQVLSPLPEKVYPGLIIAYKVTPMPGFRAGWITEITHVEEGKLFVDEQRQGPYRMWHHEHHFNDTGDGIEVIDIVTYALPMGFLGHWVHPILVKPRLKHIFAYREKQLEKLFPSN